MGLVMIATGLAYCHCNSGFECTATAFSECGGALGHNFNLVTGKLLHMNLTLALAGTK
jgi:hypothetical protein